MNFTSHPHFTIPNKVSRISDIGPDPCRRAASHRVPAKGLSKVILDNGVFRKLTNKNTSQVKVQGVLNQIHALIPTKLVATIPLWPEYVGLRRPAFQDLGFSNQLENLTDPNDWTKVITEGLDRLVESYRSLDCLSPEKLESVVSEFMKNRVIHTIRDARELARDIVYFEGQDISFKTLSDELGLFYAVDEMFYNLRFLPISHWDCLNFAVDDLKLVLREYHHLPIYRFADSLLLYLKRTHEEDPDPGQPKALKTIRRSLQGLKPLEESESSDCMFLWSAVQGLGTKDGIEPTTVITFDGGAVKRLPLLIDLLAAKFREESVLSQLRKLGLLKPGRILLLDDKTGVEKGSKNQIGGRIEQYINEILLKAENW